MKIVTVIPTFNRKDHLCQVLDDIRNQKLSNVDLATVVVVDGSTDGTLERLSNEYPEVLVVQGTGDWWYTKSMNQGFRSAATLNPDYVLTMNDDVRLPEDYVQKIFDAASSKGKPCVMGSFSVTHSSPHRVTFSGVPKIVWWRYKQLNYIQPFKKVDLEKLKKVRSSAVLPGRGILTPFSILQELDYFDESFVQYGSDDDFCLRAQKAGYEVFVAEGAIVYGFTEMTGAGNPVHKASLATLWKAFFNKYSPRHLKKTKMMIQRHGVRAIWPLTLLIVVFGSVWAHLKYRS